MSPLPTGGIDVPATTMDTIAASPDTTIVMIVWCIAAIVIVLLWMNARLNEQG